MNGKTMMMATVVASLTGMAAAQEFSGAASLGYSRSNVEDLNTALSVFSLDGKFDVKYDTGLRLGADFSLNGIDEDDVAENVRTSSLGIDGGFRFDGGFNVGAYLEQSSISADDFGFDLTANSAGLTAGYAADALTLTGFVGATDADLPPGVDLTDYGVIAGYQAAPNLLLAGSYVQSDLSDGTTSISLHAFGIAGVYGINDELTLFGGLGQTKLADYDVDVTTFGLGASLDMTRATNFASTVSLELARSNGEVQNSSLNLDTVRLGVTIPLGGGSAKVPLNSVAGSVMNPRHNAVSSLVLSTF